MASVNSVVIVGNLTRDPELRTVGEGTSVCSLRVAVNEREKSRGEWVDRANYFDVVVWGSQADACAQYLERGRQIAVQGRLRWEEWETQDGGKRQAVKITAERVQFIGSRDGNGGGRSSSRSGGGGSPAYNDDGLGGSQGSFDDDDIPF